jgi:hypothetical protein
MVFMAGGTSVHSRKTQVQGVVEWPSAYPQAPPPPCHQVGIQLASVARNWRIMQPQLEQLDWDTLLDQIRWNPDPKTRQEALRQASLRVWDGPEQPPERINPALFEPDHG